MPRAPRADMDIGSPPSPISKKKAPYFKSGAEVNGAVKEKRSRGKDGCLTCRMRRKKCETERGPDGSCKTCTRLKLECLGWGAKRPEWMRNKDLVEQKLSEIKEQLTAQGQVRGVPKSGDREKDNKNKEKDRSKDSGDQVERRPRKPAISPSRKRLLAPSEPVLAPPASPLSHPSPSRSNPAYLNSRYQTRSPAIPNSSLATHTDSSTASDDSEDSSPSTAHLSTTEPTSTINLDGMDSLLGSFVRIAPPFHEDVDPMALMQGSALDTSNSLITYSTSNIQMPGSDLYDMQQNQFFLDMTQQYEQLIRLGVSLDAAYGYTMQSMESSLSLGPESLPTPYSPRIRSITPQLPTLNPNQEDLIFYYFSRVSRMQYVFDHGSTDTMHTFISRNPQGPVASSIMALSALHDARMRAAEGLEVGNLRTANSHQLYFERAENQLMASIMSGRSLTEADATAALHLVSWWLFQGGHGRWADALKVAGDWYELESGVVGIDPLGALRRMRPEGRFAAKTTMWMDILSSITLLQPPRFSSLYQHLLKNYSGESGIFGTTNGCRDVVMFTLASIVDLEYRKTQEVQREMTTFEQNNIWRGDFIRRANALREELNAINCLEPPVIEVLDDEHNSAETRGSYVTSDVFRHGALVYLSTVTNGYSPSTTHTMIAVTSTMKALQELPASPIDRSLVFPICLAGCMTDDQTQRDFFHSRLRILCNPVGNCSHALELMEEVWRQRDMTGRPVAWRDVMKDMNVELLLV